MLLCTKNHFIKSLPRVLSGAEGIGTSDERARTGKLMEQRIMDYATDETGLQPGPPVLSWSPSEAVNESKKSDETGTFSTMVDGQGPKADQRIVYVDGGFDLFSSGHIEFLRQVLQTEENIGRKAGWYDGHLAQDHHGPAYIVAGVHDDSVINHWKGVNYPIMNIFERGLCVLQCKVILCQTSSKVEADSCQVHQRSDILSPFYTYEILPGRISVRDT